MLSSNWKRYWWDIFGRSLVIWCTRRGRCCRRYKSSRSLFLAQSYFFSRMGGVVAITQNQRFFLFQGMTLECKKSLNYVLQTSWTISLISQQSLQSLVWFTFSIPIYLVLRRFLVLFWVVRVPAALREREIPFYQTSVGLTVAPNPEQSRRGLWWSGNIWFQLDPRRMKRFISHTLLTLHFVSWLVLFS